LNMGATLRINSLFMGAMGATGRIDSLLVCGGGSTLGPTVRETTAPSGEKVPGTGVVMFAVAIEASRCCRTSGRTRRWSNEFGTLPGGDLSCKL
jgi:hypothetical protein